MNVRLHLLLDKFFYKKNVANKDKYSDCELNFVGNLVNFVFDLYLAVIIARMALRMRELAGFDIQRLENLRNTTCLTY